MIKMTTMCAAVALAFGAGAAQAAYTATTTGNNFTMIGGTGLSTGGTNDVTFTWDGSLRTSVVTNNTSNASLSSPTPFFGKTWTAHNVNLYAPGTYVFDSACPTGNPACTGTSTSTKKYTLVVPTGMVGAHMLFDWSTSANIDVVQLYKYNTSWAATAGTTDPFFAGTPNPNGNTASTIFNLVSVDTPATTFTSFLNGTNVVDESNLYHGTKMIDGPFIGQSANFNLKTAVPVPAAAWLLGSGLLGLIGVGRRKMAA